MPPFYTGKQKILDSGGRVARFEKRYGKRKGAARKGCRQLAVFPTPDAARERRPGVGLRLARNGWHALRVRRTTWPTRHP